MKLFFYQSKKELDAYQQGIKDQKESAQTLIDQMNEKRPLPTGMQEFEDWSDRIISGTLLQATPEVQKFALASMLMHLGPTVDHECDGYFIKSLRKVAVNEIAHAKMNAIKTAHVERQKDQEANEDKPRQLTIVQDPQGTTGIGEVNRAETGIKPVS